MSNFFIVEMNVQCVETFRTYAYHLQVNVHAEPYNTSIISQLSHYMTENPTRWDELILY